MYIKRQTFDDSIPLYYLAAADDVINLEKNIICYDDEFKDEIENLLIDKQFICNNLKALTEYYKIRLSMSVPFKSNYHIFRVRNMVEQYDTVRKYEIDRTSPWITKAIEYKKNFENEIGKEYLPLLHEQLIYFDEYRNRMMKSGLE